MSNQPERHEDDVMWWLSHVRGWFGEPFYERGGWYVNEYLGDGHFRRRHVSSRGHREFAHTQRGHLITDEAIARWLAHVDPAGKYRGKVIAKLNAHPYFATPEDAAMFAFTTLFDMKQGLVYSNPKED